MNKTFNLPLNGVSFGQTSIALLREIYKRNPGDFSPVFPIGQTDLSAQKQDIDFTKWLQAQINGSVLNHDKNNSVLRLWHILQSCEGIISKNKNCLFTFHETSEITKYEKNVLNCQDLVFVSSPYTKQVFESGGVNVPVILCPLGFDSFNFQKTNRKYYPDDRIVWGLNGKAEVRKSTYKILKLWAKKYGNNKNHVLHCLINNNFIDQGTQNSLISQALEGKKYFNINFLPYCKTNAEVNSVLNAQDINLDGLALCEGFNYGLFNSLCLGKQAVVFNSHIHKLYCNDKNSVLINQSNMIPAEDNFFFKKGNIINQGEWADWNEDDASAAMDLAALKAKSLNTEGEKLKEIFSFEKTVDSLLKNL